ncbi:MAG: DUF4339 domain-containing protein [Bacteroidales bacterium]|nr:DUF4339 domain-containing protein [Bacteroidales bacterium]
MDRKDFFYANGKEQIGPISFEELKKLNLDGNTLIWYDELNEWTKINSIPEIYDMLEKKKSPPPLPNKEENINKTDISGEVKLIKEKNKILEPIKPTQKILQRLLIWTGINILALITSYAEIPFFSNNSPKTDEFWPFVSIIQHRRFLRWGLPDECWDFNGLFYSYDWTEFLVYVGGAYLIFIIIRLSNKDELKTSA